MKQSKKIKSLLSILISITLLASLSSATQVFAEQMTSYDIEQYVDMEFSYMEYFDNNFTPRYSSTQNEKDAANYIASELSSMGYEPAIQLFTFNLKDQDYNSQNVVVTKKGLDSSKKIVIGAHYDSVQETHGIDDNASGVALILAYADMISEKTMPYDIDFVFFGSEELGMEGSKAYLAQMSDEDKSEIQVMINADCVLVGTYCYVYGGNVKADNSIEKTWGVNLAKQTADELGLDVRLNDTELAAIPTPTGVKHSDHASFQEAGIPYIYFEATNWELPDDPLAPEKGSTGDYETELGRVMHNKDRDNLTYIENQWDERSYENLTTYTTLLPVLVDNLDENISGTYDNYVAKASDNTVKTNYTIVLILVGLLVLVFVIIFTKRGLCKIEKDSDNRS